LRNCELTRLEFELLVPIKAAASDLSLPIHEIDTFTGWTVIQFLLYSNYNA